MPFLNKCSNTILWLTFLILAVNLSACDNKPKNTNTAAQTISVVDHTIRAMPPGQTITAMFMTLHNPSLDSFDLVRVETEISEHVELHQHKMSDGMMQMSQVDQINIKAQGNTELKPGGFHVMLIGLKKDLEIDQKVELTLIFKDQSSIKVESVVQKIDITK